MARCSSEAAAKNAEKKIYDVLVCGGGVVGSAFIVSLLRKLKGHSQQNSHSKLLKIGIIEYSEAPIPVSSSSIPHMRVYALSPRSISMLKSLGAWEYIEPRSQPYTSMQVWECDGPGVVRFSGKDMHLSDDELGRICEGATIYLIRIVAILSHFCE